MFRPHISVYTPSPEYRLRGAWSRGDIDFQCVKYVDVARGKVVVTLPDDMVGMERPEHIMSRIDSALTRFQEKYKLPPFLGYEIRKHQARVFLLHEYEEDFWVGHGRTAMSIEQDADLRLTFERPIADMGKDNAPRDQQDGLIPGFLLATGHRVSYNPGE